MKNDTAHDASTIESVIQEYVEGYLSADAGKLANAFHPETRLLSTDAGQYERTEMQDWITNIKQRAASGDIRTGAHEFTLLDAGPDAAVAKVTLQLPKTRFVDYLSLLRIQGEWKIVGKTYSATAAG